jgi:hypothetical protein
MEEMEQKEKRKWRQIRKREYKEGSIEDVGEEMRYETEETEA